MDVIAVDADAERLKLLRNADPKIETIHAHLGDLPPEIDAPHITGTRLGQLLLEEYGLIYYIVLGVGINPWLSQAELESHPKAAEKIAAITNSINFDEQRNLADTLLPPLAESGRAHNGTLTGISSVHALAGYERV